MLRIIFFQMTSSKSKSIYESEQYLFEIAQSFIRSRIIFTSIDLQIFDLLLLKSDGLSCSDIGKHLNLHFIENQSRCLEDCLDCLTAMNLLEFNRDKRVYQLTKLARNYLLPNRSLLTNIENEFYSPVSQFYQIKSPPNPSLSSSSLQQLILVRIKQYVNLSTYSNVTIDACETTSDAIIFWNEENFFKEKFQQAFDVLPSNGKGLFILVLPTNDNDEISLAMNICLNKNTNNEHAKDVCSKKFLKQIGFRSVEKVQTTDDLQLLLAFK